MVAKPWIQNPISPLDLTEKINNTQSIKTQYGILKEIKKKPFRFQPSFHSALPLIDWFREAPVAALPTVSRSHGAGRSLFQSQQVWLSFQLRCVRVQLDEP